MTARLLRILPEIAARAAALPSGILELQPWLAPIRNSPAIASASGGEP